MVIRQLKSLEAALVVRGGMLAALAVCTFLAGCVDKPLPRSFTEFMDDGIAREGTLVRCNADRAATSDDPECINARRAAAAIAAQDEAQQRAGLKAQSEVRLAAARQRYDAQHAAELQSKLAAEVEERREYESQWADTGDHGQEMLGVTVERSSNASIQTGSAAPIPSLEPISLPASVRAPLTTIALPHGVKPLEYQPSEPKLEEIVLPSRIKPVR